MNSEEQKALANTLEAMTDALLDIACGGGPLASNELAIHSLTNAIAVLIVCGVGEANIDHVAAAIGETIADKARALHGIGYGEAIQ